MTKRQFILSMITLCACFVFSISTVPNASAHTTSSQACLTAYSNTTTVWYGSTDAHVSLTVWHNTCNHTVYASANSVRDSNGFAFTGTVEIVATNGSVTESKHCSTSGTCDTPGIPEQSAHAYYVS